MTEFTHVLQSVSRISAERKLVEDVEQARADFEEAMDEFLLIMSSFNRSGRQAEWARSLGLVTARKDLMLQQLRQAVDRLNGFVLYGVVPGDLDVAGKL